MNEQNKERQAMDTLRDRLAKYSGNIGADIRRRKPVENEHLQVSWLCNCLIDYLDAVAGDDAGKMLKRQMEALDPGDTYPWVDKEASKTLVDVPAGHCVTSVAGLVARDEKAASLKADCKRLRAGIVTALGMLRDFELGEGPTLNSRDVEALLRALLSKGASDGE